MRSFLFRIDRPGAGLFEKTRAFERDDEASAYASQLLRDWPDCAAIDVLQAGALIDRLKPIGSTHVLVWTASHPNGLMTLRRQAI